MEHGVWSTAEYNEVIASTAAKIPHRLIGQVEQYLLLLLVLRYLVITRHLDARKGKPQRHD